MRGMTEHFYRELKGFSHFADLTQPNHYTPAPSDWFALITDVKHSTVAIQQGRYKEVNMIGAASIMAVLNACKGVELPYAFGGDGATLLVPAHCVEDAARMLCAVQARVRNTFGMELRAGFIALSELFSQNTRLEVAKFHLSPHISQAVFQGNALSLAERWLKEGGGPVRHCEPSQDEGLDLQGLECRWEPIHNRHGAMLSVLVKSTAEDAGASQALYSQLLADIERIYPDDMLARPVQISGLKISLSPQRLSTEIKMRNGTRQLSRLLYFLKIIIINLIGRYTFTTGKKAGDFDGRRYLSELVANSDSRKFDEMLRMVVDSTAEQHQRLEKLLDSHFKKGQIVYGIHSAQEALMTCLVFNLAGSHVHFIDGADGGYALAALQMKQQIKARTQERARAAI